jgi:methionyl aminopeptidase
MIIYKTEEEIELIKQSANILSQVHGEITKHIGEGVTTLKLDTIAEEFIQDNGGFPSFKGYNGFKHSLCISLNSAVVHGIPSEYTLQSGDVVSIDCGVFFKGFHSDSAYTHAVGEVAPEITDLLRHTKDSLYKGIEYAVTGSRIGDIGYAIQSHVEQFGYGVVRELVGHGLGQSLHESPEVPNFG